MARAVQCRYTRRARVAGGHAMRARVRCCGERNVAAAKWRALYRQRRTEGSGGSACHGAAAAARPHTMSSAQLQQPARYESEMLP